MSVVSALLCWFFLAVYRSVSLLVGLLHPLRFFFLAGVL
jgi:hypothetical protein